MEVTKIEIKTTMLAIKDGQDVVYFAEFKNGRSIDLADLSTPLEPIEHETKKFQVIRTVLNGQPYRNYLVPVEWIPVFRRLFFDSREQYDRINQTIKSTQDLTIDRIKSLSWWKRLFKIF